MQRLVQGMTWWKNFRHASSQKLSGGSPQEFLRSRADHYGSRVPREQQQSVFEPGHDGVHVFPHGAEDFMHPPQLLSDLGNLPAHQAQFIAASSDAFQLWRWHVVLSRGDAVQLRGDIL